MTCRNIQNINPIDPPNPLIHGPQVLIDLEGIIKFNDFRRRLFICFCPTVNNIWISVKFGLVPIYKRVVSDGFECILEGLTC